MENTRFADNGFHLNRELDGEFRNLGNIVCESNGVPHACQALSSVLEPPQPMPPDP
jgi:hypothetical protein